MLLVLRDLFNYAQEVEWIKNSRAHISEGSNSNDLLSECPICMDKAADVVLPCAHAICQSCHESWMETNSTCPLCRSVSNDRADTWVLAESSEEENKNQSRAEAARLLTYLRSLPNFHDFSYALGDEV